MFPFEDKKNGIWDGADDGEAMFEALSQSWSLRSVCVCVCGTGGHHRDLRVDRVDGEFGDLQISPGEQFT